MALNAPPPYTDITGISRAVMKDNAQETLANYNGNARPGELVVDLTNNDVYIGNTNGNLNLLVIGGGSGNSEPAGPVGAIQYNAGGNLFGGTANVTVSGTGIVVTGNVTAGNVVSNTMISNGSGNITFTGNIVPSANTFTLGTSTTPWADAFFGPESITILDESGNIGNSVVIQNIAANIVIGTTGFTINEFGTTNSIFRIEALTGQIFSAANTIITNTAQSSNVASGSLQTAGGAGIAKDLYVGGNITGNYFIGNGSQLTGITANTSNITSNVITFNTSAGISVSPGQMAWNSPDGTVDIGLSYDGVVLQVGQETHYVVRNATGNTLPNGTSVYCSGVTAGSGRMEASKFVADGSISPIQYLGLCTMDISNGVNGVVTCFGYVRDLDTRGTANTAISVGDENWAVGDKLYVHPTAPGKLTKVEPAAPNVKICVASVIIRNQAAGILFVRPTTNLTAADLSDVQITTPAVNQFLVYAGNRWENTALDISLDTTPALGGNLAGAGFNISNVGNVTATNLPTKFTGSWSVPTGNSTQSFTVDGNHTYQMWVEGNIPNGIIAWNALVTVTNINVPVLGQQFAWNYEGGGNVLMFNTIPAQIIGTAGAISNVEPAVANTNVFSFGINNASGNTITVDYGWVQIS